MATATMTPGSFADRVLQGLGDQPTSQDVQALEEWETGEGGAGPQWGDPANTADYNPLDTTLAEPGSSTVVGGAAEAAGVQSYTSWQQGVAATVSTLEEDQPGYAEIRQALAEGTSSQAVEQAVLGSKWGTTSFGTPSSSTTTGTLAPSSLPTIGSKSGTSAASAPGVPASEVASVTPSSAPGSATTAASGSSGSIFSLSSWESVLLTIVLAGAGLGLIVLGLVRLFPGSKALAVLPLAAAA